MPEARSAGLLVSGFVSLEPNMGSFRDAHLSIVLEDISLIDAPSRVIARHRIEALCYEGRGRVRIPFEFCAKRPNAGIHLSVRAHLALHGGDRIELGDWVTVRSYPVSPPYPHLGMEISLREVR